MAPAEVVICSENGLTKQHSVLTPSFSAEAPKGTPYGQDTTSLLSNRDLSPRRCRDLAWQSGIS